MKVDGSAPGLSLWRRLLAALAALAVALLIATWRKRLLVEPGARQALDSGAPVLAGFWHDSLPAATMAGRSMGASAMISDSRDGLLAAAVLRWLGVGVVTGSPGSPQRGAGGLLRARRLLTDGSAPLGLALDGSRGPRRRALPGILVLARHAGAAVLPIGCASGRSWVLRRTWDRTRIPWPFSRVVVVIGEPIDPAVVGPEELPAIVQGLERRAVELIGQPASAAP